MAEILKPIVINFPDRGSCAVDYIDYFDEGQYGPDKAFFVGRFQDLKEVATQINQCLALQSTEGSIIHGGDWNKSLPSAGRLCVQNKWIEPLQDPNEKYPQRAQYKIRFLLRIKFYGEFAYLDLGAKWKDTDELDPSKYIIVKAEELEVVNRCWISKADAEYIKNILLGDFTFTKDGEEINEPILTYDGSQYYSYDKASNSVTLSALDENSPIIKQLQAEKELESAILLSDGTSIISDENGLLSES